MMKSNTLERWRVELARWRWLPIGGVLLALGLSLALMVALALATPAGPVFAVIGAFVVWFAGLVSALIWASVRSVRRMRPTGGRGRA